MELVTAYKPSCCNKAMLSKASALRHERNCPKNPENRCCPTCGNFSTISETVYNPNHGGDPGSTDYEQDIYHCDANVFEFGARLFEIHTHCKQWKQKED